MAQNSPVNPAEGSKDLATQLKELQQQVSVLEKKASIITPEVEELIELHRDIERYERKCCEIISNQIRRMNRWSKGDFEDSVYQSYRSRYGKIINDMEQCIEKDIMGHILDKISIYNDK